MCAKLYSRAYSIMNNRKNEYISQINDEMKNAILRTSLPSNIRDDNIKNKRCCFRTLLPVHNRKQKTIGYRTASCGKCLYCKERSAMALATKMEKRFKLTPYQYFITFTQDESDYQVDMRKRIRKMLRHFRYIYPDLAYYGITEFGPNTFRSHAHFVIGTSESNIDEIRLELSKCYPAGFIDVKPIGSGHYLYIAGYSKKLWTSTPVNHYYSRLFKTEYRYEKYDCTLALRSGDITPRSDYPLESRIPYLSERDKRILLDESVYDYLDDYGVPAPTTLDLSDKEELQAYQNYVLVSYSNFLGKKLAL